jgi:hypothetical protein
VAAPGFVHVVRWRVPCVWGQQRGTDYARAFKICQPACRAALEHMPVDLQEKVLMRLADKAGKALAVGRPIACDVAVVRIGNVNF